MTGSGTAFHDADYPALPYPGRTPDCSFVHVDEVGRPLRADPGTLAGWRVAGDGRDLDDWLAARHAPPLAGRVPVLTYGSNRCPEKITWLRRELGLRGPAVVLDATVTGVAAVWAAGLRARDGQRPAVLAAAPGVTERHAVWLATPEQVAVLDRCEGRGERYRLARLRTGEVRTADGVVLDRPWCYLAHGGQRRPLLVGRGTGGTSGAGGTGGDGTGGDGTGGADGPAPVRCAAVSQERARTLVGAPAGGTAPGDGLAADPVTGAPHPDQWPELLFSYGLLRPGYTGWSLVEPHRAGEPHAARVAGTVHDTGLGYPALLPDARHQVDGVLVPVHDPRSLLPALDTYEGPDYRRVRVIAWCGEPATPTVAWAYTWIGARRNLRPAPRVDHSSGASGAAHSSDRN
ncbi:MAG TPA: gamma-glutamylcyclotransferase [Pseudonocardia sp.]